MRANKKLEKCTEKCKYNSSGICAFGLRNSIGCFLDEDVRIYAGRLLGIAKEVNTIEIAKSVVKGRL